MELTLLPGTPYARPAAVLVARAGLAVVGDAGAFRVAHIGTGLPLVPTAVVWLNSQAEAERAMEAALALPVDWTADAAAITARVDRAVIGRAMERAAHPPRRMPYWDQRRRLRPYQAEARRSYVARFRLDWYDGWDGPTPPRRQPCRRFVARAALGRAIARRAGRGRG